MSSKMVKKTFSSQLDFIGVFSFYQPIIIPLFDKIMIPSAFLLSSWLAFTDQLSLQHG